MGLLKDTILGLPQATKDVGGAIKNFLIPGRGFTDQQITQAKPTLKEKSVGLLRSVAEVGSGVATAGKAILTRLPVPQPTLGEDPLATFAQPKTAGEAATMRLADIASLGFGGGMKNIGKVSKVISATKDVAVIEKELKGLGMADNVIKEVAPKLVEVSDPVAVSKVIGEASKPTTKKVGLLTKESAQELPPPKVEPPVVKPVIDNVAQDVPLGNKTLVKTEANLPQLPPQTPLSQTLEKLESSSIKVTPQTDPVKAMIQALRDAGPVREAQQAAYTKARGEKLAKVVAVGKKVPGEQGFYAQLGQLKGELPKVQFEGIRKNLTQDHVDSLFEMIRKNEKITEFEKISAQTGLKNILGFDGGIVPTRGELKLLREVFPEELVQTILQKRTLLQKLWGIAGNAINLPRAMMSTLDLSAPLRQGIFMVGRPKQFLPAFKDMFKYAFSEKSYDGLMARIEKRPTYHLMRDSKLAITNMGADLTSREEAFMSNLAERIPIFGRLARGSNRAYTGFLNQLRADVFDDLLAKGKQLGIPQERFVDDLSKFINSATGRGDLGMLEQAAPVLNAVFFSPRLMASRLNLLNPVYYAKLDPFVRKEALKSLLTFAGVGTTMLTLANLGGMQVGADPRSADFGKLKTGDTRYDIWGGFQQYIVLAARLITGQMVSSTSGREFNLGEGYKPTTRLDIIQKFFGSKESPIASFVTGWLSGQTAIGEKFSVPTEMLNRLLPIMTQDVQDLMKEYGPAKGAAMAIPGIFGVGSQTYGDQIPLKIKTKTGKDSIEWRQPPSLGEQIINKVTGKQVTDIPPAEQEKLRLEKKAKDQHQADLDRAKQIVLSTGETQKVGDTNVFLDNGIVKVTQSEFAEPKAKFRPTYDKVQQLIKDGKKDEALKIVNGLTEKEYDLYKRLRTDEHQKNTSKLRGLLKVNPKDAVKFVRSQSSEEAKRLLEVMTDKEYAVYQQAK